MYQTLPNIWGYPRRGLRKVAESTRRGVYEPDRRERVVQTFPRWQQMSSATHVLGNLQPAEIVMISQMFLLYFEKKKKVETLCVKHIVEACEHYSLVQCSSFGSSTTIPRYNNHHISLRIFPLSKNQGVVAPVMIPAMGKQGSIKKTKNCESIRLYFIVKIPATHYI